MAASRNVKLGLFALAVLAATITAGLVLGIRAMAPAVVTYHTYFDESVQGLELGAPVKYRGVRIGSVADIAIAADRKTVDVELALRERDARRLGLVEHEPRLRAQLGLQGLTGLKFVDLDFFEPDASAGPPFPHAAQWIPSRRSLMKGLVDNLESVGEKLPDLATRMTATLDRVDLVLDDLSGQRVPARLGEALDRAGLAAVALRRVAEHVDGARLPERATSLIASADQAIAKLRATLDGLDGAPGLVASARRASDSLGDLGRTTLGSADDLARTVRDLGDAARAIRELAEEIERDPDMLVKGRARSDKR